MVQSVHGRLGLAEPAGDLAGAEADDVAQDDDLALVVGQRGERLAERQRRLLGGALVLRLERTSSQGTARRARM